MATTKSLLDELCDILDEAGVTVTFSQYCRTGLVGDLCRCWRCRKLPKPDQGTPEAEAEKREAELIDRAHYGFKLKFKTQPKE